MKFIDFFAGKQAGFQGNRSSLFFRVMYLVVQLKEEDKPTYLFIENVKNLLSVNGGWDFARLLIEMDQCGYDAEWQVLNSKDFGVPQNRERCFIIGHLRGRSTTKVFPIEGTDGKNSVSLNLFGCLIRKLTPKECFRLQGWSDDYFEKAQFVNSDSQLYKQAGNGVTVTVIEAIARKMKVESVKLRR